MSPTVIDKIIKKATSSIGKLPMVNYPYETNFLRKLPANPVAYACSQATKNNPKEPIDFINSLAVAA
jgi:hypothetical protein